MNLVRILRKFLEIKINWSITSYKISRRNRITRKRFKSNLPDIPQEESKMKRDQLKTSEDEISTQ